MKQTKYFLSFTIVDGDVVARTVYSNEYDFSQSKQAIADFLHKVWDSACRCGIVPKFEIVEITEKEYWYWQAKNCILFANTTGNRQIRLMDYNRAIEYTEKYKKL